MLAVPLAIKLILLTGLIAAPLATWDIPVACRSLTTLTLVLAAAALLAKGTLGVIARFFVFYALVIGVVICYRTLHHEL